MTKVYSWIQRPKEICLCIITVILSTSLISCDSESEIQANRILKGDTTLSSFSVGSLELSLAVIDDLEVALVSEGLTSTQVEAIKTGALAGLNQTGLSLTNSGDPYSIHLSSPRIVAAAIKTFGDPTAEISTGNQKLKLSGVVTKAVLKSMRNKIAGLSAEERESLPGGISESAVASLDDAGLSGDDLLTGISTVVGSTVGQLDEAGFKPYELLKLVQQISQSSVSGMAQIGLKKDTVDKAMQSLVKSAVGALDDAGVKPVDIGPFVEPIVNHSVGGLDDLGLSGASQMQSVVGNIMGSAVTALSDAGVSESSHVAVILNKSVKGAMSGIGDAGVVASDMSHFLDDMMQGMVDSLDDIGIKDAASIQSISAGMASDAIGFLDDFGVKDQAGIKVASNSVANGVMGGLGKLQGQGIIDKSAVESATAEIASKAVDALYLQSKTLGFDQQITDVASGFTTGMVEGLAEAGWKNTDISSVSDDITTGFKSALSDETSVNQENLTSFASTIETSTTGWISDQKNYCIQDKGIWHSEGGWCEYPLSAPVAGAIQPSQNEIDDCFDDGGSILYSPDGSWFCDISSGGSTSLGTREDCEARGYLWILGPEGKAYCETGKPPTNCWENFDGASCNLKASCTWTGRYCEDSTLTSCPSFTDTNSCLAQNICIWDRHLSSCVTDVCLINPGDPQCLQPVGNLNWAEGANTTSFDITARWALSSSKTVFGQRLSLFRDEKCVERVGTDYKLGPEIKQYRLKVEKDGTYTFRVDTFDEVQDEFLTSVCSPGIIVASNSAGSTVTPTTPTGPVVQPIEDQSVVEGSPIARIDAEDTSGGDRDANDLALSYSCTFDYVVDGVVAGSDCSTLSGVTFDQTTGILDWTTVFGQDRVYEMQITASNGISSDFEVFAISVLKGHTASPSPEITAVSSSTIDGYFTSGATIPIELTFSEPVVVTGTPSLALETGATDRQAIYQSGSNSNTLTFLYSVQVGDTSADLDYASTSALDLNGGTIVSLANSNGASLVLPDPGMNGSLSAAKNLYIDTLLPLAPSAVSISSHASSSSISVNYTPGSDMNYSGSFIKACASSDCSTGCSGQIFSSSSPDVLSGLSYGINYYVCAQSKDLAGNLSGWTASGTSMLLTASTPTVLSVSSNLADDFYSTGVVIAIDVNFSESVVVVGTPTLTLETGSTDRIVNYSSGSGTSTLTFQYTVGSGDLTPDLDYVSSSALALNGGSIVSSDSSTSASLVLATPGTSGSLGVAKNFHIDTLAPASPSGLSVAAHANPASISITYTSGSDSNYSGTFLKACTASDCSTGCMSPIFSSSSPDILGGLTYGVSYYACAQSKDHAGNLSSWVASGSPITLNTTTPTVSSVSSTAADGYHTAGAVISIDLSLSEAVNVSGTPSLTLETGTTDRSASYSSGSGTSTLTFIYNVQNGDESSDLDYISTNALSLNGGTILSVASSTAASLTLPTPGMAGSLAISKSIQIDAVVPSVPSSLSMGSFSNSSSIAVNYVAGSDSNFYGTYLKACTNSDCATGCVGEIFSTTSPDSLSGLADGVNYYVCGKSKDHAANYSSWLASGSTIAVDLTAPSAPTGLNVSEGAVSNGTTMTLNYTPSSDVNFATHSVKACTDSACTTGCTSEVTGSSPTTITGLSEGVFYGCVKGLDLAGNSSVWVASAALSVDLTAPTAPTAVTISESSPSNSSTMTVTFSPGSDPNFYTNDVKACTDAGCSTSCVGPIQFSTSPASVTGLTDQTYYACVRSVDSAGNQSGYVSSGSSLLVDTTAPIIVGVLSSAANTHYKAGDVVNIAVQFDEAISVSGSPTLSLNSGGVVNYSSGSGTSTLNFLYTIGNGENSPDLDYSNTSALSLNGASIADAAGNPAGLVLAPPGGGSSLGQANNIVVDTTVPTNVIITDPPSSGPAPLSVRWSGGSDTNFKDITVKACTSSDCATGCLASNTSLGSPSELTTNLTVSSAYYLCGQVRDIAGNVSNWGVSSSSITISSLWGDGSHGSVTTSTNLDSNDASLIGRTFSASARAVSKSGSAPSVVLNLASSYTDSTDFAVGDEVLWVVLAAGSASSCNADRGKFGMAKITSVNGPGSQITIDQDIDVNFNGDAYSWGGSFCFVQIVRVPHFTNLTVSAGQMLSVPAFNSSTGKGGVLALRTNSLTVDGTISAVGAGFQTSTTNDTGGDGLLGPGGSDAQAYGNGGQKGVATSSASGGGGGHGAGGASSNGFAGGSALSECSGPCLPSQRLFFGGAAGRSDAGGGHGGGIILIYANQIAGTGTIDASGQVGQTSSWSGDGGGGGGTILMPINNPGSASFTVRALGGNSSGTTHNGGGGGGGAVLINSCTSSGASSLSLAATGGTAAGSGVAGSNGYGSSLTVDFTCP